MAGGLCQIMPWTLPFISLPVHFSLHLVLGARNIVIELKIRDFRLPPRSIWILALFWFITQRIVTIAYRRFGTTYRSHSQGLRTPRFELDCRHTLCDIPEERRSEIKYSLTHKLCLDARRHLVSPQLLGVCDSSFTAFVTSFIWLLATILLTLFSSVNIWKVFFLTSWQRSSAALKVGSVCIARL